MLSLTGQMVLHAAAVRTNTGAVAFLGAAGAGKSTLSASFCQGGWELIADDCVLLEDTDGRLDAVPSYPGIRLWAESLGALFQGLVETQAMAHYSSKRRVGVGTAPLGYSTVPAPVRRLYVLGRDAAGPGEPPRIERLRRSEACIELVKHCYHLDIHDPEALRSAFERIVGTPALGIVRRLIYQGGYAALADVRKVVLDDLAATPC
jgi:hypothetical protein